jgi:hypothetical protein
MRQLSAVDRSVHLRTQPGAMSILKLLLWFGIPSSY